MTPKSIQMWAIVNNVKPWIIPYTVSETRKESIRQICDMGIGYSREWKGLYRVGFRAVKVKIEVME